MYTGLIQSPKDDRDILSSQITPDIKRIPEIFPPFFDLTILNQKNTPHCVGFSCAAVKQEKELREKVVETFDGDWIYNEAKKIDGLPNFQGTYLRSGMKVLLRSEERRVGKECRSRWSPYH